MNLYEALAHPEFREKIISGAHFSVGGKEPLFFDILQKVDYDINTFFSSFTVLSIDISLLKLQDLLNFFDKNILNFTDFEVKIEFLSDYTQSKIIRDAILNLFERNNINLPWKNRFALISDELVNNSIEYGSMPSEKNNIYIKFVPTENGLKVEIEVSDTGHGLEAKTSQEMEQIRKLKETQGFSSYLGKRGRGLFQLITNLVDELYFRDCQLGGLTVGIRKEFTSFDHTELLH